ncbi:MAG: hypothetical protein Q8R72_02060 [Hylemonella sp.]|nr:hypothetical protein [Hylemonella sp.]
MKTLTTLLAFTTALAQPVLAGDLSALGNLSQSEFRTVSEDLGAAFSYKPIAPTEAQGITGFDIGLEVTGTDISRSAGALSRAGASDSSMNTLLVPKLHLHKGLPLGIDVGAFIANIQAINANLYGAEVRYALLDGGVATPAIGVRGAYTQLTGVNQLAFSTRSLDISISKGFTVLTPYAGVGQVWVTSSPNAGSLAGESFSQGKLFVGLNVNLGLLNLALETDRTGNTTSWGMKAGLRW